MRLSSWAHAASIVFGIWGFLALVGAWLAGEEGTIFGFSQAHCYVNAVIMVLLSISAGVCAIYRLGIETNRR